MVKVTQFMLLAATASSTALMSASAALYGW